MTETLKNSKTEATKEKVKEHSLPIYQWASKLTAESMGDEVTYPAKL
jgi:hypothetical protein